MSIYKCEKHCTKGVMMPIVGDFVYFFSLLLLLYIPSLAYWIKNFSPFFKYYGIMALPAVFFAAYVLCSVVNIVDKLKCGTLIKRIIFIVTYILTIVETFIILFFGTRFNPAIITLLLETNPSEASGFVTSYILTPSFVKYIVGVILFTSIIVLVNRSSVKKHINRIATKLLRNNIVKTITLFVVLICVSVGVWRECRNIYWHKYNIDEIGRIRKRSTYSTSYISLSCLYDACRMNWLSTFDLPKLVVSLENTEVYSCKYKSNNIVVVIGESFSKHHSSLYGYPLSTNPLLEKENNLYVFNDAITTDGLTSLVMKNLFSFRDKENNIYWAESTLFPAIFKKAGYNCIFISNQEVEESNPSDVYDMANGYLVSPLTKHLLWNVTNENKCQYDMQLIDDFATLKDSVGPYSLTVFHLIGQHTAYEDRYPRDKAFFTKEDYEYRTDLTDYQKSVVAHFDNAIRYGDEVLNRILDLYRNDDTIVIFFSDHGEEMYDCRNFAGRSHEPIITSNTAKYVYEVPFFIWMSDEYKRTHQNVVNSVDKSLDKPFVLDDLPHLLLDLAGIECENYDSAYSILNDKYFRKRRLIGESKVDYNVLIKK